MLESTSRVKELCRRAIDQDSIAWGLHAVHDPLDLSIMKVECLKSPSNKLPAHPIIGSFLIQLDHHQALINRCMLKIMHEFLGKQDVVGDVVTAVEHSLLLADQAQDDRLQSSSQNPHIYFIESGLKIDQPKMI